MNRPAFLAVAVAAAALWAAPAAAQQPHLDVTGSGPDVVVRLGPVRLPAGAGHDAVRQPALQTWEMPSGGWIRGYRVEVVDARGAAINRATLHHAELVDLERRDLLRPALNRIVSAGSETSALMLPRDMGYPVRRGQRLGVNAMLHNPTRTAYPEAWVRITLTVIPDSTGGVRAALGFYGETTGDSTGDSSYDLPAGRSDRVERFTVPIAGRILAAGGHIHDYGTRLLVTRMGANDTVYSGAPRTDSAGQVTGMMPAALMVGDPIRVAPGDRFVMTVSYDNPTGRVLEGAAMGTFAAVFVPDDLSEWPALDTGDPAVARDLARLRSPVQRPMRGMEHMHRH